MEHRASKMLGKLLYEKGGDRHMPLVPLWQNWDMVMGEELAELGRPLGHKDRTIIIGADDNMAQYELSAQTYEVLERVNAFLGKDMFDTVQVELMQGRESLDNMTMPVFKQARPKIPPRPKDLGNLEHILDPDSPVTKCYKKYVAMYDGKKEDSEDK
ncbi:DUF721 domain-containing protein [Halodesulfovibrio spirochaetisodalis]|uniref:Uncharacterized protein n=1 Tax=Halodesulfovibrio spirochaetisodalis TaxID=1560234 RepID=A0A1B7XE62_9BACT|nr:DUF721 domain-containing protein [Halodesulfovibrio spirochaetisodalis]OBQ52450.1 hypothetical protein SP90_07775 [Halodesulfovibrio spirochaetisodalis]